MLVCDKKKQARREEYLRNKDKYIARARKWAENNPDKRKDIVNKYNKKRTVEVSHWHQNKQFGLEIDRTHCQRCFTEDGGARGLVVHHSDGNNGKMGKPLNNSKDNLVVLCRSCHAKVHRRGEIVEVVIC